MRQSKAVRRFSSIVTGALALAVTARCAAPSSQPSPKSVSVAPVSAEDAKIAKWTKDLKNADRGTRHEAAFGLNRCGAECRSAVPALVEVFRKGDSLEDRSDAGFALDMILKDEGAKESMRLLVEGSKSKAEVAEAVRAIKQPDCRLILSALAPGQRPTGEASLPLMPMANLLGNCGGKTEVSSLVPLLKDPSPAVQQAAVVALIEIGPEAQEALPALHALLKDADPSVRDLTAAAIEKIGSK